ncbi:hypothetical protein AXW84_11730 [Hymenobacter sp. PAMC 26628]|nr:hypothetical protein AXW84_11730 [Hymenobacter sp. PAMC 26628]
MLAVGIGTLLNGCGSQNAETRIVDPPTVTGGQLLLTGVTVVDTHDGHLSPNMSVLLGGGKIISLTPTGPTPPAGAGAAKVIDARGKFVVPGYLEMHAHPLISRDVPGSLALFLANGITGFRQMNGTPELLEKRRNGTLRLGPDAPELLAMPGEVLNPLNAGSPEAVVQEVRKQKAEGADFIKVVTVSVPTFFTAQAEAKRLGLPFVGHLPEGVPVQQASRGGMKSIEHLGPNDGLLVACSTEEGRLEQEIARLPPVKGPPVKIPFADKLLADKLERIIINPLVPTPPADFARLQRAIDTYSDAKDRQLAAQLVADGTWQVPTLIRLRTMELGDAPEYVNDPNQRYIPAVTAKKWHEVGQDFTQKLTPAFKATYRNLYALQLRLAKLFEETHVPMLAGSDFGGGWLVPGFSLHQEFDELQKAGLAPLTVLQMTTLNGAKFLNRTADTGSVEPGKNANLVLLDANPLADVQNLHRICAVVRAGRYYAHADLENLKQQVATRQAAGRRQATFLLPK